MCTIYIKNFKSMYTKKKGIHIFHTTTILNVLISKIIYKSKELKKIYNISKPFKLYKTPPMLCVSFSKQGEMILNKGGYTLENGQVSYLARENEPFVTTSVMIKFFL